MGRKLRLVEVHWVDSVRTGGWRSSEEYTRLSSTPVICSSVGYVLKSDRMNLVLVQSLDDTNDNMTDSIAIPRSAVRKVTPLERKA